MGLSGEEKTQVGAGEGHAPCLIPLGGCQRAAGQGLCVAVGHRGGLMYECHKRTDFQSLGGIYNSYSYLKLNRVHRKEWGCH